MELNFRLEKNGENLVIAVAQDWQTNEVLMVAFTLPVESSGLRGKALETFKQLRKYMSTATPMQ